MRSPCVPSFVLFCSLRPQCIAADTGWTECRTMITPVSESRGISGRDGKLRLLLAVELCGWKT